MNPFKQIDFVFFILKERSELSADFSKEYIWDHIKQTPEIEINRQKYEEILQRLLNDGYIKETIKPETQPTYHLTFGGRLFPGYEKEEETLNQNQHKLEALEKANSDFQNSSTMSAKKLNLLPLILAIGTLIAALYYVFEILNHWFYIYPEK